MGGEKQGKESSRCLAGTCFVLSYLKIFKISDYTHFGSPLAKGAGMGRGGEGGKNHVFANYFSVAQGPRIIVRFTFGQTLFSVLLQGLGCHGEPGEIFRGLRFSSALNQILE